MLEDIAKGESLLGTPLRFRTSTSQIWALHGLASALQFITDTRVRTAQ